MSIKESKKRNQLQTNAIVDIQSSMLETSKRMGELSDNVERLTGIMVAIASSMKVDLGDNLDDASDSIKRFVRESDTSTDKKQQENKMVGLLVQNIRKAAVAIAEHAQSIQNTRNQLVRDSSLSQAQAYAVKNRIESIVDQMNSDDFFKPKYATDAVFQDMSKLFISTSTRDEKTLDTITGPLTLASQTMSIDMGKMTTMFSRFYTRYTFSSEAMNETLESILQNSANSNVSQEKLQENIDTLSTVAEANARYQFNGDSEAVSKYIAEFNDAVTTASARYEAVGLDTSTVINELNDIMQGNVTAQLSYLSDGNIQTIKKLMQEGSMESVNRAVDIMMETRAEKGDLLQKSGVGKLAAGNIGVDNTELLATANAIYSGNVKSLDQWLLDRSDKSLEDQSNEKFVGVGEAMSNAVANLSDNVSSILQEFGLSGDDMRTGLMTLLGVTSAAPLTKFLSNLLTGGGSAGAAGGAAAGAGAGTAGAMATVNGALSNASTALSSAASAASSAITDFAANGGMAAVSSFAPMAPAIPDVIDSYKSELIDAGIIDNSKELEELHQITEENIKKQKEQEALLDKVYPERQDDLEKLKSLPFDSNTDDYNIQYTKDDLNTLRDIMMRDYNSTGDVNLEDYFGTFKYNGTGYAEFVNKVLTEMFGKGTGASSNILKDFILDSDGSNLRAELSAGLQDILEEEAKGHPHATGLQSVPHDNYFANLHEGERVLTKSEAETLRRIGNLNNLEDLYKEKLSKTQQTDTSSKELVSMMGDLISILLQWRDEESSAIRTNERLTRLSYATQKVSRYEVVN